MHDRSGIEMVIDQKNGLRRQDALDVIYIKRGNRLLFSKVLLAPWNEKVGPAHKFI